MLQCLAAVEALPVSHLMSHDPHMTFAAMHFAQLALLLRNNHLHPAHLALMTV